MTDNEPPIKEEAIGSGTKIRYSRDAIVIEHGKIEFQGIRILPAEILHIAARWTEYARDRGWRLCTPEGHQIDFHEFTRRMGRQIADLEDAREIRIVFDGPPGAVAGRFVEVEDVNGHSIKVGKWFARAEDNWYELRIPCVLVDAPPDGDDG